MNINKEQNLLFNLIIGDKKEKLSIESLSNITTLIGQVSIINLKQTLKILIQLISYIKKFNIKKHDILILSPEYLNSYIENLELYNHINTRWLGGTLTNFQETKNRIHKINKENSLLSKKDMFYINCLNLKNLPKIIICLDPVKYNLALLECKKLNIPTVVFCNPTAVKKEYSFPIIINTHKLYKNIILLNLLLKYI